MSWAIDDDYEAFKRAAHHGHALILPPPWLLHVWDVTDENPEGVWHVESNPQSLQSKARLRIVFAPFHDPEPCSLPSVLALFRLLHVPSDFTTSVLQSVCHSFGRKTDNYGCCSWFHFLFKNISLKHQNGKLPEVDNRAASAGYASSTLPQADYSWLKSSFFLRQHDDGGTVLVCFGAQPRVWQRIELFIDSGKWADAGINPYVLFDLVLDGLYFEVDETVWNMNTVFGPLEHVQWGDKSSGQ
ncbi:uncharacterized protein HRG_08997 [Hirsutella rhossiliensis]|uniref:Uncharacterized protein n=1 Tax=Hirsutella rhossiliensis TaxID=111463 RepID=A0A9P8SGH2_9HYPO|nr:uncharacterized protein HRG_08997 [Hirsutella rhossiliensis]KAH0959976.1 hypothetical protein HRG_08997 [Hirsutella rhossiliensis]